MQAKPKNRITRFGLGWNEMSENIEQFVVRRRGELDEEVSKLEGQLRAVESERERIDKVAALLAMEVPLPLSDEFASQTSPGQIRDLLRQRSPRRASEASIKAMVIDILEREGQGMTALAILAKINERVEFEYPRTSLSPQLSRLKADGKVHREGLLWTLGGGPDVADADGRHPDYWVNRAEGGEPERKLDEVPDTEATGTS